MGAADYYLHGSFNRICDRCGGKFKAASTRREPAGRIVCAECFDEFDIVSHPQNQVRGRIDRQIVPDPRPEPADVFKDSILWFSRDVTWLGGAALWFPYGE